MRLHDSAYIFYEHPLNEHARVCLRLESLFTHIEHYLTDTSVTGGMAAISALLETVAVLDRPDLRTRLSQELNRYLENLLRLQRQPNIDTTKLNQIMGKVENNLEILRANSGKFAQELRTDEFLASIRQHVFTPGGACCFDTPNYYYWLHLPASQRQYQLQTWLNQLSDIRETMILFLNLTRESALPEVCTAQHGFYQTSLDAQAPNQLVRIGLLRDDAMFPQCSIGCHGVSIRFMEMDQEGHTEQLTMDCEFLLTCCAF